MAAGTRAHTCSRDPQLDDPITMAAHDLMLSVTDGRTSNGCPLTATAFVTAKDTQCGLLLDLYRRGYEIAGRGTSGSKVGRRGAVAVPGCL